MIWAGNWGPALGGGMGARGGRGFVYVEGEQRVGEERG